MRKKLNRWLALLMAVTMIITSAVYTTGIATASESALKAAEEQFASEGGVDTATGEAETLPAETTEPEVVQQDVPQQEPVVVVAEEQPVLPEQPAETQPMTEIPVEETPVEVKYTLTLHKPDVAGGTIQSWTTGEKTDRTDGYTEEITENTIYNMEVTAFENYEVEKVTDQHGNVISPKSVTEQVYLYEILMTNHIELNITYKEIPKTTPAETTKAEDTERTASETKQEEAGEGIYATSDGFTITLHNTPFGDLPAYCYNAERSYPFNPNTPSNETEKPTRYKDLVEYSGQEGADANAVRNLLYAGNPFDALGYRNLAVNDWDFRIATQNALWVLLKQRTESIISQSPSGQAIYKAAQEDKIPKVGELRVDNENITFAEEKISTGNGYKWIYKTEPISLSGYTGTYELQLPEGIRAFDGDGNERTSFSTLESFHLEADNEEALNALISENKLTMSASYSYSFPKNIYYAEAVDKQYQNLLCWTTSQGTVTATFSAEAQITAREGYYIYYTLNGDSEIVHETSIQARDSDDFHQQFETDKEALTQNSNLKDYCGKNDLDYKEFKWDEKTREVNNAIYLNFNAGKTVTVTFDPQGGKYAGDTKSAVSLPYGGKLLEKETTSRNPGKQHYDFSGWYDKSSGGEKVTYLNRVLEDTILYAQYTPAQYSLTVKIDGTADDKYAQTKGYKESFDNSEYTVSEGYYIASVTISGGSNFAAVEYTTDNEELSGYTNRFKLPSIPRITKSIEGNCLVEIKTAQLKNMTVSADPVVRTYDGKEHGVEAKVNHVIQDVKVYYYNEQTMIYDLETSPLFTDVKLDKDGKAEPYTVAFKATAPGYKDATGETTVTINPRPLTVKADDKQMDPGEKEPPLTHSIPDEKQLVKGEKPAYKGALTREDGTAPGTYAITQGTLELDDNKEKDNKFKSDNYILNFTEGTLTIYGTLNLSAIPLEETYNGKEQALTPATVSEEDVTPIIEYSRNNKDWSQKVPTRKNVTNTPETIYVRAYVEGAKHYKMAETTTTITITPATLTVTADSIQNLPYGTEIPALTGTITGFFQGDSIAKDVEGTPVYTTDATAASPVGNYTINTDVTNLTSQNYVFHPADGTLSIVPTAMNLEINGEGGTYLYDSMEHTLQFITITGIGDKVVAGWDGTTMSADGETTLKYQLKGSEEWFDMTVNGPPVFTNAGTYTLTIEASNPNYRNPVRKVLNVIITQRPLEIQVHDSQKDFGQDDPTFTGDVLTSDAAGFTKQDEEKGAKVSFKRTNIDVNDVGTYEKALDAQINWGDANKDNYAITITPGDFTINPLDNLSFTPQTMAQVYNGQGLAASAAATEGATIEYSMDGENWAERITQTDVPASADNTYYVHVRVSKKNYVTKQSDPNNLDTMSKIVIRPAPLVVVSEDQTISFEDKDDLELPISSYGAVGSETPAFSGELALESAVDKVGPYKITIGDLKLKDHKESGFKERNYTLSHDLGTVTVTGTLTLTHKNYDGIYDGREHTIDIKTLTSSDGASVGVQYFDGNTWSDAGENQELLPAYKDVPGNSNHTYTFYVRPYANGYPEQKGIPVTVTIRPAAVHVNAEHAVVKFTDPEKDSKLENLKYTVTMGNDTGEKPHFIGALGNVGDRVGTYNIKQGSLALTDAPDGNFKASNYILNFTGNTAQITGELHLNLTAYNNLYDAKHHTVGVAAAADDGREELLIEYTEDGEVWKEWKEWDDSSKLYRKDVTDTEISFRLRAKNNSNYTPIEDTVKIKIDKAPLTIKARDFTNITYGSPIPALTGDYIDGLVGNESLEDALTNANGLKDGSYTTLAVTGSPIGDYEIVAQKGNLSSHNYELIFQPGTLTIVPADNLAVAAEGKDVIYNGDTHTLEKVTFTGGASTKLMYSVDGGNTWQEQMPEYTEVGIYPVLVKAVNDNYTNTPVTETVYITIRPKDVTIQVSNATKTYGTNDPVFSGVVDGLIEADDLGTVVYGRDEADRDKEEVGDDITLTAAYTDNKNYNISVITGKLDITPVGELHVTVTDTEVVYDGNKYGIIVSPTPDSTPMYSTDGTNWFEIPPVYEEVGEYEVFVKTVQDGYTDSPTVSGKVTILPRQIEITAESAEKAYDGTPLVATSAYLTSGTLADGEEITSITVNGSQTEVGNSANVADNVVIMSGTENVTRNYQAQYVNGTLTVREVQAALIPILTPIPPVTPAAPTPPGTVTTALTPVAPGALTEIPADVNAPTEAEGVDRGYDLTEVADTETPLANMNLDDHDCCIFHFLLMLMLLLVSFLYTRSMKKRQKRMFKLQEEYELELIRHDLEKYDADGNSKRIA